MIRYFMARPIGICLVAFAIIASGLLVVLKLPVSLLPNVPVPIITVQADYPNASAREIQDIIALPLRNQLLQLNHLNDIEAVSEDGSASLKLIFEYGTDIDFASLEVNEKVDLTMEALPHEMARPRVIKAGSKDIPILQLNVSLKSPYDDFIELSDFTQTVLRRRLEQMPEVAFVDITGLSSSQVTIQIDPISLSRAGISVDEFTTLITDQSSGINSIVIKDGPYEYSILFDTSLKTVKDVEDLPLRIGGKLPRLIRIGDLASVSIQPKNQNGFYNFNGRRSVGMAIIKRNDAQLFALKEKVDHLLDAFRSDYPKLNFEISQNQTELLELSISNLIYSITLGAVLSFVMIFMFIRRAKVVLIIGLIIPVSISLTLLGFFVLGMSINIVSLAGLLLGIGEIVDSAIIIVENIEHHWDVNSRNQDHSFFSTCSIGANDVIRPLAASVLTNSLVFLPLVFLSGIAGTIFIDQAASVSLALSCSLITSYILVPVLYFQFFKNTNRHERVPTRVALISNRIYGIVFTFAMRKSGWVIGFWGILFCSFLFILNKIDIKGMPEINRTELEVKINWNEPIQPEENERRLLEVIAQLSSEPGKIGLFVGSQQFLLNTRPQQSTNEALMIIKIDSPEEYQTLSNEISSIIGDKFSAAVFSLRPALNPFEQLFQTDEPELRLLISDPTNTSPPSVSKIDSVRKVLAIHDIFCQLPTTRERIQLTTLSDKLLLYSVDAEKLKKVLRIKLNEDDIGILQLKNNHTPILLATAKAPKGLRELLSETFVENQFGELIRISQLLDWRKLRDYQNLYLGRDGSYVPMLPVSESASVSKVVSGIDDLFANDNSLLVQYQGLYFRNRGYLNELTIVVTIAIALLFFVLAAQFESMLQPMIVLVTISVGIVGALTILYLTGNSLNIMSGIGLVVLIGLLDNDSILKIDTMNRDTDNHSLIETIRLGGQKRLHSQLMTFFTTQFGLLPVLWSTGLGAELQKPLAIVVIAGMSVGIFLSWTLVPLTYYWLRNATSHYHHLNHNKLPELKL